jgi:small GTP-binding protein
MMKVVGCGGVLRGLITQPLRSVGRPYAGSGVIPCGDRYLSSKGPCGSVRSALTKNKDSFPRWTQHRTTSTSTLGDLLSASQKKILVNERAIFDEILKLLQQADADQADIDIITETKSRVDDVFLVVVVGEFNAGKSTFINSLLGEHYLKVGVLPTTSKIGILRSLPSTSGAQVSGIWRKSEKIMMDDVEELDLPVEWLQHVALIDTPGTNAIIEKHEALTMQIVPRSDLILFVTSAERPITDSEKSFLQNISKWGKKVIVVVNKIDLLSSEEDRQKVLNFVATNVGGILGSATPIKVFGVSSADALKYRMRAAKEGIDPRMGVYAGRWLESGITEVESYLKSVLGQQELIKNKLLNPLTLADRILANAADNVEKNLISSESDFRVLQTIETINAQFSADLDRDRDLYISRIQSIMTQFIESNDQFLCAALKGIKLVTDKNEFMKEYKRTVVLDLAAYVNNNITTEMCELIAKKAKQQSGTVSQYLLGPNNYRQPRTGKVKAMIPSNTVQDARIDNITRAELMSAMAAQNKALLELSSDNQQAYLETVNMFIYKGMGIATAASLTLGISLVGIANAAGVLADQPAIPIAIISSSVVFAAARYPSLQKAMRYVIVWTYESF